MYENFYGFKEKPFNILPDPDYLFMSKVHENAYTHLEYAVGENQGFVVITGEIGSGKTTLINYLVNKIEQNVQLCLINQTYLSPTQFIKLVCQEFELNVEGIDKADMIDRLHDFLFKQYAEKERVILIIDEAQNLTSNTLEELRMLSNLETEKHHLIQMILVGQPELKITLNRNELLQFAQRVTVNCHISSLSKDEVGKYIKYRIKVSGAENCNIFDKKSIETIYSYSNGVPRLINILCDAALVYGYAESQKIIGKEIIESVIKDREAGGIFTKAQETKSNRATLSRSALDDHKPIEDNTEQVIRRINIIENRIDNIDQRLTFLSKNKEERDNVVIELFKLLKGSMESRMETLQGIAHARMHSKNYQNNK